MRGDIANGLGAIFVRWQPAFAIKGRVLRIAARRSNPKSSVYENREGDIFGFERGKVLD